ncbi:MAG: ArsR/SmtB family transcription factor [Haloarculaceae archaeon]
MGLLPSRPDTSAADEASPRVVGVDSDRADDLMSALGSDTARRLLTELHEEPAAPSALADRADTSLQNAQYHLQNLEEAGLVEVIDTAYSEKGREMDIYAPADRPLVIFAGREEQSRGLRDALGDLVSGVAAVALGALAVQELFGRSVLRGLLPSLGSSASGGDGGAVATGTPTPSPTSVASATASGGGGGPSIAEVTTTASRTATPMATGTPSATPVATHTQAAQTTVDTVAGGGVGLPPGVLFFLGGLLALLVVVLVAGR